MLSLRSSLSSCPHLAHPVDDLPGTLKLDQDTEHEKSKDKVGPCVNLRVVPPKVLQVLAGRTVLGKEQPDDKRRGVGESDQGRKFVREVVLLQFALIAFHHGPNKLEPKREDEEVKDDKAAKPGAGGC